MTWIGRKKLAPVALYRSNAHPPDRIPADWPGAPVAADNPAAFTVEGPDTQHIALRANDNHIDDVIR